MYCAQKFITIMLQLHFYSSNVQKKCLSISSTAFFRFSRNRLTVSHLLLFLHVFKVLYIIDLDILFHLKKPFTQLVPDTLILNFFFFCGCYSQYLLSFILFLFVLLGRPILLRTCTKIYRKL